MKRKFFVIGAVAVIAIVGLFVFEHATSAQRPDRNAQGQRGNRGGRGMPGGMMMNYGSLVENSWIDLTFSVKVDDATLVKARPVYQEARDQIAMKVEAIRQPDTRDAATKEIQTILKGVNASLKEILTEEQMTKLSELTKKRATDMQQRMNRWRGGEGGRRGGGGSRQ